MKRFVNPRSSPERAAAACTVHTVRSLAAADIDASRGGNRTSGVGELPTRRAVSRSRSVSSLDTDRRCCYVMVDIRCLCIELVDRH